ncbi:unnamed protein product [Peronospora belbahrii]|uniref:F-box domain-containing protein n=1 Tax=Peronospora belbahrii TaxID=622444 RepID=A0AAU9KV77_9STRA|nr:unnamed protein product [Peronospora belbahrii]
MASHQLFYRDYQHPKEFQRSLATSVKSDVTSFSTDHQSTDVCACNGIKFKCRATSVPSDVWTQLLPFLTWQDTNAMLCVCNEWRKVMTEAKKLYPEWRSTVIGPSLNGFESLELLRANHLKWADTCFAPDLVLLSAASRDSSPWHTGGYWEEAIAAIEEARLLPPGCRIAGMFTMNAVLGTIKRGEEEQDEAALSSAVTLSVSVVHLLDTTVEMAEFDRKDLRRCHRGMELSNPFSPLENDVPSFLMFGVNDHSASQLVAAIDKWYPGAAIVGAISSLSDRCVPLVTYCGGMAACADRLDRKKKKGTKQKFRRRSQARSQVVFPSTMLLRLHGKVSIRPFSSSGYQAITPVIRCVRSSIVEKMSQVVTHDLVAILNHEGYEDTTLHRVMDLLHPSEILAIERESRALNIFSCQDSAPLKHLFDCCSAHEDKTPILDSVQIDRLECVFWLQNSLMSLPRMGWQEGFYGILASHHSTRTALALAGALRITEEKMSASNERVLGAFMVAGALNEVEDLAHAKEINQLCAGMLRKSQFGGCVVSISVGPVALPGGVQMSEERYIAQVQTHTTCGAVFYTKT